ncbi:2-amino-4-hydroxy-6-hydroxymethyldihydropteridine diphosphokinase [Microbacterium sp. SORGH_AS_0888]|uniref:2-amino-4-hydroxy-6- hydroxymethyldihydropteridine diphosphokinase n=1 Tax=Microbacterium sp. SORGH_AS_0888 TaxID=3041791 RepID=UPI0027869069|nr:2-amino-4-hydroxy-6-hydroxymethyldihydropteridine diphosphokinase [Microbacterium sp. SORGH_AS_0888]MDQ1130191.1 2-amino-4-hydroxy-6-hydroxymethyldihydropteridine diphosphokinase [Microbacterium sp. SORGH_AS_0888]
MNRRLAQGLRSQTAVVAFGANLGDRAATIEAAAAELRALPLVDDVRLAPAVSSVAVKPDGPDVEAPGYLNTVALVRTRLAPSVLLACLHEIERRHGRVRVERWGDRTLDLDLIAYGEVRSTEPALVLPHPHAAERDFVLRPWLALDPEAELPGSGRVSRLLATIEGAA